MNRLYVTCLIAVAALLSGCEGILGGIYDEISYEEDSEVTISGDTICGSLYIEANAWDEWFYIDFHAIRDAVTAANDGEAMDSTCLQFNPYKVPMTLTGEWDGHSKICTYRFRVLTGGGLSDNEYVSEVKSDTQPEPESWDMAIHRSNNRTNGGSALETSYDAIDDLPKNVATLQQQMSAQQLDTAFVQDVGSDNEVFVDNSTMLSELIPCQSINVNQVLSRWLTMEIPPFPPAFTHNSHVFLLRMNDGTVAALQCTNYISAKNVKCCLTIEYRYPY